jgi:hypothetical protein
MSWYSRRRNRVRGPKPVLVVEDYKNSIGQTIKPNDDIIIVTTCTGRTKIAPGVYLGTKNGHVSCRTQYNGTQYRNKETGLVEENFWNLYTKRVPYPRQGHDYVSYNSPEYSKAQEEYSAKSKAFMALYDSENVPMFRGTTLQLDRIYKIDTSVFDLKV